MNFKHSCFISYSGNQSPVIRSFVERLREDLDNYFDLFVQDLDAYVDFERLKAGHLYGPALAGAIFRSLSMIVVYAPSYEKSSYCRREYLAMEEVERRRSQLPGVIRTPEYGLIIPVILAGSPKSLPPRISARSHYHDLSPFVVAGPAFQRQRPWRKAINDIAEYIYQLYQLYEGAAEDACADCDGFSLPEDPGLSLWRGGAPPAPQPFPLRVAA